jgi:hypothetical protein
MSTQLAGCSLAKCSPCLPRGRPAARAFLARDQWLHRNPELDFSDHPMATVTST